MYKGFMSLQCSINPHRNPQTTMLASDNLNSDQGLESSREEQESKAV